MKIVRIYCEGKIGSHDYDILEKVLGDLGTNIEIKPLGGKMGAKAIMNFNETMVLLQKQIFTYGFEIEILTLLFLIHLDRL